MSSLLILTVGTGTSGKHSNLAQGLVNTPRQLPLRSRRAKHKADRSSDLLP